MTPPEGKPIMSADESQGGQMGNADQASASMWSRMLRAARLEDDLYEEVEADSGATGQALAVVVLVSVASGIGLGIGGAISDDGFSFVGGLLAGVAASIAGWLVWAAITYWIGSTIFRGPNTEASYGQLLRTLAFAQSPGCIRVFAFIPGLGGLILLIAAVWTLVSGVIAVRQALDFSTGRAIGTVVVGWIVYMVILGVVGAIGASAMWLF